MAIRIKVDKCTVSKIAEAFYWNTPPSWAYTIKKIGPAI